MNDTQSQTESLLDIVRGIEQKSIMLPEFQRDFRWELEQSYDLFDSLIREIFIGTLIYGKLSFALTLREIDRRPRKGKGSNAPLQTIDYSMEQIKSQTQTKNLRIVLDGQQRITSIYRAIVGIDPVYITLRPNLDPTQIGGMALENVISDVVGEESPTAISVRFSVAYQVERDGLEEDDLNQIFSQTLYAQRVLVNAPEAERKSAERLYRRAVQKLRDLYKQQKLVAYYLLDMSLEKFCTFFERSNSRGIQLNFIDILAAKLYRGFNLRRKIEEFETQSHMRLNREAIVRAIAFVASTERGGSAEIDKSYILENLTDIDFRRHWDEMCARYAESMQYLLGQYFILSQDWMPFENMIIPLMLFRREVKGFDQIDEGQRSFLEFWFWASVFANRYSAASNEVIITDCYALVQVARGQRIDGRGYFNKMRSLVTESEDLLSYTKRGSAIYRGVLNLLAYHAKGLRDWNSTQFIDVSMRLEDHHIFPRAYIASAPKGLDVPANEAEQMVDCVVNRTLIPKLLNIQIGKKSPHTYLTELQVKKNKHLATSLPTHLVPADLLTDSTWDTSFGLFLEERATAIFSLIERYVIEPLTVIATRYGASSAVRDLIILTERARLKDMIAAGKVQIGEEVYVRKHPDALAVIVDGDTVRYAEQDVAINLWAQQMTGWTSVNIYEQVFLKRLGQPLKKLREP